MDRHYQTSPVTVGGGTGTAAGKESEIFSYIHPTDDLRQLKDVMKLGVSWNMLCHQQPRAKVFHWLPCESFKNSSK